MSLEAIWNKKTLFHLFSLTSSSSYSPPPPMRTESRQVWHWCSIEAKGAAERRCLVPVKSPEVDRIWKRICAERREVAALKLWKYQVMRTNWDAFNLERFLCVRSFRLFKNQGDNISEQPYCCLKKKMMGSCFYDNNDEQWFMVVTKETFWCLCFQPDPPNSKSKFLYWVSFLPSYKPCVWCTTPVTLIALVGWRAKRWSVYHMVSFKNYSSHMLWSLFRLSDKSMLQEVI